MATTDLNILLNVGFNKEVGEDGALYFTKESGNLANLIDKLDTMNETKIKALGFKAKNRVRKEYTWNYIIDQYEDLLVNGLSCYENVSITC
ncbi:glycosyltransferase involved in cell wall biosynthesis [Clostridium saccharobutylicum]|nr:glycosyltransferase involved in cell wall biosynthesis [Clostridium saccharobutylicum]